MDPTDGSETSANINQTLGIHPKIETVNTEHSESLKSILLYFFGPTFGIAEIRLFLFAAQCFNTELMQKGYPNYRWDLIRYVKG
jgi:hypothetical protein